jgi:hypothetical protein
METSLKKRKYKAIRLTISELFLLDDRANWSLIFKA